MNNVGSAKILQRNQTPLPKAGGGIATENRKLVAIQVRFKGGYYPDKELGDGRIIHIGMGRRLQGSQKATHGNGAMLRAEHNREAFPVYEMVGDNAYRFLGRYVVQSHSFGIIDERYPKWQGYQFMLRPVWTPDAIDEAINGVEDDPDEFAKDIPAGLLPDRRRLVREIIKRNRTLAEQRKRAMGYACEICLTQSEWLTAKGMPYVEAHHIIPLGDNGFDDKRNLIIVCADCHRRLHYSASRADELRDLRVKRGLDAFQ